MLKLPCVFADGKKDSRAAEAGFRQLCKNKRKTFETRRNGGSRGRKSIWAIQQLWQSGLFSRFPAFLICAAIIYGSNPYTFN